MTRRTAFLWIAVTLPIAAWTAQLLLAYFLVSLACAKGVALPLALHATTLVAAALTVAAVVFARRRREDLPQGQGFISRVAALGAAVLLVGIVFGELPVLLVRGCL